MHNLSFFFLLVGLTCSVAGTGAAYNCHYVNEQANEPQLPTARGFIDLGNQLSLSRKQTSFRIGYDKKALYFFINCEEGEMNKIKAENRKSLWQDDSIELFLLINGSMYQFIVNTQGAKWSKKLTGGEKICTEKWSALADRRANGYAIKMIIPFSLFNCPDPLESS
ncbi:MAG: sugar-binding protein [Victivallaceae bacterium]|nr:sugar-binding protein [Victivallaceae bacterium]